MAPRSNEVEAATRIAALHDALGSEGDGRLLIRVVFCLFAQDSGVFAPNLFSDYIEATHADGSDLAPALVCLFERSSTPLFSGHVAIPTFDTNTRAALLRCAHFDWSTVSPAVFGSIVTAAMDDGERRRRGAHYTSEADIMKLLRSLFLDDLEQQLGQIQLSSGEPRRRSLVEFHEHLCGLRLLDPACGCGDFLLLAYRELHRLEHQILHELPDVGSRICIQQFYGIELQAFAAEVARVSLWLLDHQLNRRPAPINDVFIHCGNALRIDWNDLLPAAACSHVFGNPPFVGKQARTPEQVRDMQIVFGDLPGTNNLDYVCAWYKKAADYIVSTDVEVAYVSTNSMTQGEQPGLLWPLLDHAGPIEIVFAHRSFPWRADANVHVVIIGFAAHASRPRKLHDNDEHGEAQVRTVNSINPYLVEGRQDPLFKQRAPLDPNVPRASYGNMPNDGGHLLLTDTERTELLHADPPAAQFIRPFISAKQFLAGVPRWCIWLHGAPPATIQASPNIMARIDQVRAHRHDSPRPTTRKLANSPTEFAEIRQPTTTYVLIPRHPSERRPYIPIGYFTPHDIIADSCIAIPGASKYHFGVLCSAMHNAWIRQVAGRIKSDLRYSIELVYNNFPWPTPTPTQHETIKRCATQVLDARNAHPNTPLSKLYNPTTMPKDLTTAHHHLDTAVDAAYAILSPITDTDRVAHLFTLRTS